MANPVITAIPISVWTKVATGVTAGAIYPLRLNRHYFTTHRVTTDPPPTDGDLSEGVELPETGAVISSSTAIDVYVAVGDSKAGSVRVDL